MTILIRIRRLTDTGFIDVPSLGPSLPTTPLYQSVAVQSISGRRSYNGEDFDFTAEGLYCIFAIATSGAAYADGEWTINYTSNVIELLRGLMFQTQYGRRDESLTAAQALDQLRLRKLGMRCGFIDQLVAKPILTSKSFSYRSVSLVTAATPNNFDDGHVGCEIKIDGIWKYFDIPNKLRFESSGAILNIHDLISGGGPSVLNEVPMCPFTAYPETWSGTLLQTQAEFDQSFLFPADAAAWRQRIYQIPGIADTDGNIYFYMPSGTSARQSWLLGLSSAYRVLSESDWLARFYP